MNWYVINVPKGQFVEAMEYFKTNTDLDVFSPKIEKFYCQRGQKYFKVIPLFPNRLFIKSTLDGEKMYQKLSDIDYDFSICYLNGDRVGAINSKAKNVIQEMMDETDTIRKSEGNIVESKLQVYMGPLKGFESLIRKIDRHKRYALLDVCLLDRDLMVPLEVPKKTV